MKLLNLIENIEFILDKESEEYQGLNDDYKIIDYSKIEQTFKDLVLTSLNKFKERVNLWKDIKIVFVNKKDFLGMFRSETSTSIPIILLSYKELIKSAKQYKVPLWVAIETTIFHELGHAICELERIEYGYKYLDYSDEEDWVENFAYELHEYDSIPQDLEEYLKARKF